MATVQEPVKASGRHDRFVEQQLTQATRRVLLLDLTSSFLMLLIGTTIFGLAIMFLDRAVNLPQIVRQIAFLGFLAAAGAFVWFRLLRPFRQPINPYYAARQVEQTIPDAKNSVINWLDLHNEDLPPAVHTALGSRAAADLKESDLNEAVPAHQLGWLGGIAGGLLVGVIVALAVMRPGQFLSLFERAFNPFSSAPVAKQTNITVIEPQGGSATVPVKFSVTVRVRVDGRIPDNNKPDSMRLLLRRNPDDTNYEEIALAPDGDNTEWKVTLGADRVQNGFWYKVAGGDDETPEYHVAVRSSPLLTRFDVTYKFRPYLQWLPRTATDPNIEALRGTEVTLKVHTNRDVRDGRIVVDPFDGVLLPDDAKPATGPIKAALVPGEPDALQFKFIVNKETKYRIYFSSVEGESNKDPLPYTIKALRDMPPEVNFTKPLELLEPEPKCQLQRPANGMLRLEGTTQDDYGLTKITLRMKLKDGTVLEPKTFHQEKDFKLETGAFMRSVEYMDFVEIEKLKTKDGAQAKLGAGAVLEYWLEAEDNCDFPGPNIGSTKHFTVLILAPKKDEDEKKELQEQKEKAQQDKQDNDKKFDQQHQKDNEESKKQQAEQQNQAGNKDEKNQKKDDKEKSDSDKKVEEMIKKEIEEKHKQDANNQPKKDEHGEAKGDNKPENGNQLPDEKNPKEQGSKPEQAKPQDGNQPMPDNKNPNDRSNKPDQNPNQPDNKNPNNNPDNKNPNQPDNKNPNQPDNKNGNNAQPQPHESKGDAKDMKQDGNMQPPAEQKGPPQEGSGAGDSKPKGQPQQPPQKGDPKPAGEKNADPSGMGESKNQPEKGAEGGTSNAKQPPKNPMNPMNPNQPMENGMNPGANPDPKQNNEPGNAKGQPDKSQKPENNPNNPNPNDPKNSDNKQAGQGAEGQPKPDNQPQEGQAKKKPDNKEQGGGTGENDQPQDQPGAAKAEKPPQQQHGKAKPSDNAGKNPPGEPKGQMAQGNDNNSPEKQKDPGQAKSEGNAPMGNTGQFEQSKGDAKGDNGASQKEQANNKQPTPDNNGAGGKDDVAKLENQMKNGDPKASQDAKQQLEQMAKDSSDPQKQKAAQDALKKDQQDKNGQQLGAAKKPPEKPEQGNPMTDKAEQIAKQKPNNAPKQEPGECKH
ncbi:MAG TPA: hypothetical protein VKS79_18040 [Gemmataceae bacterium]|nr:hypothetical protein [Gemmataceae bacterium]